MNAILVHSKGSAAIIEMEDGTARRVVPLLAIQANGNGLVSISDEDWQRGIEQDFDFNISEICISVEDYKVELHRRGLYSSSDIKSHLAVARAALLDAAGETIARLLNGGS